jgi:hypothetical protein
MFSCRRWLHHALDRCSDGLQACYVSHVATLTDTSLIKLLWIGTRRQATDFLDHQGGRYEGTLGNGFTHIKIVLATPPLPPVIIIFLLHSQRSDCIPFIGCCKFAFHLFLDLVSKHFLFMIIRILKLPVHLIAFKSLLNSKKSNIAHQLVWRKNVQFQQVYKSEIIELFTSTCFGLKIRKLF